MKDIAMIIVGILLLIIGFLVGVLQKISIVHSYHYKRVDEIDKPLFCKGVGIGNALVGLGILLYPVMNWAVGETVALWVTGILSGVGLVIALAIVIKYNKGLF